MEKIAPSKTSKKKSKDDSPQESSESRIIIKQEPESDTNQSDTKSNQSPSKQSPQKVKKYESYVTTPATKINEPSPKIWSSDKNIVEDQSTQNSLKMKLKTKQKEGTLSPKKKKTNETKGSTSNDKKEKRKSLEKLIVSIKKKTTPKTKDKELNSGASSQDEIPANIVQTEKTTEPDETNTTISKSSKHKAKKKKKKKEKVNKEQSNIEQCSKVETFPVSDTYIVKVKKKKIFKKKNGEKVLVRITRSHCNRNDEVVKLETFLINENNQEKYDPVKRELFTDPVEQNLDIQESFNNILENINIEDAVVQDFVEEKEIGDTKVEEPEYEPIILKEKKKKQVVVKKTTLNKSSLKKTTNKVIKKTSRPANKVVTVGGKVVGKTTKGMKTTGSKSEATDKKEADKKEKTVKDYEENFAGEEHSSNTKKELTEPVSMLI